MATVGVRDLRQRASELLRRVEAGEKFEITNRGRPMAVLGPLPDSGPLARLHSAGEIEPAVEVLDDLPEPLSLEAGAESPSDALARMRRDER